MKHGLSTGESATSLQRVTVLTSTHVLIDRVLTLVDQIEGLADRLCGSEALEAGIGGPKSPASGVLGELAERIDRAGQRLNDAGYALNRIDGAL